MDEAATFPDPRFRLVGIPLYCYILVRDNQPPLKPATKHWRVRQGISGEIWRLSANILVADTQPRLHKSKPKDKIKTAHLSL